MPKLPRLTAREICSVLEKLGFSMTRQSGSHMIYKNAEGKRGYGPISRRESSSSQSPQKYHARRGPERRRPTKTAVTRVKRRRGGRAERMGGRPSIRKDAFGWPILAGFARVGLVFASRVSFPL